VAAQKKRKPPAKRPSAAAQRSRREKEAAALKRRLIVSGVLVVLAGAVVFVAARPESGPSVPDQLEAGVGSCRYDTEFDGDAANQGDHVANPKYEVDPPAGGPHLVRPAPPGFYVGGKVPADGSLVHAMEHGFVVLWISPDLSEERMGEVEDLSDRFGRELIVAERPGLAGEAAVTAWHRRLLCRELVPAKVALFTASYKDQGPEKGAL
jgi:hypothetical protein